MGARTNKRTEESVMSRYGKTYTLGSSEAMKQEPRLDEDYYYKDPELEMAMNILDGKEFNLTYASMQKAARLKALEE